jgi:hypothetical protein
MKRGTFMANWDGYGHPVDGYDLGALFEEAPDLEFFCYAAALGNDHFEWRVCEKLSGMAVPIPANRTTRRGDAVDLAIRIIHEYGIENLRARVAEAIAKET